MGRSTKKVENNWFSATVSNAQQRQEQSFRTVCRATLSERKGSHLARKFACSWFHLLPLWWLFFYMFIRKCCVCTCWKKWRQFFWSFTKTGW